MHILDEPVGEERQGLIFEVIGKELFDVLEPVEDVDHRLGLAVLLEGLAGEERVHAGGALLDVEVEGALAEFRRKDQVCQLPLLLVIVEPTVNMDQQQGQRGKALLPIDDKLLPVLVRDDDRS